MNTMPSKDTYNPPREVCAIDPTSVIKPPTLILLCGNVGSGKSTVAACLARRDFKVISKDSLRLMLNGGEYVFQKEFELFINHAEGLIFEDLLVERHNIVVDNTNVTIRHRKHYIDKAQKAGYQVMCMILPRLSNSESMHRKLQNSFGVPLPTWNIVWDRMDKAYEHPNFSEGIDRIVQLTPDNVYQALHHLDVWWDDFIKSL